MRWDRAGWDEMRQDGSRWMRWDGIGQGGINGISKLSLTWKKKLDDHAKTGSQVICLGRYQTCQEFNKVFNCFITTYCPSCILSNELKGCKWLLVTSFTVGTSTHNYFNCIIQVRQEEVIYRCPSLVVFCRHQSLYTCCCFIQASITLLLKVVVFIVKYQVIKIFQFCTIKLTSFQVNR